MRRVVVPAVALLLAAGCAAVVPPADRSLVLGGLVPAIVQVRAELEKGGRRSASGVVVAADAGSRRSWVLTARHFLEGDRPARVAVSSPGRRGRAAATVAAVSPDADLAILTVNGLVLPAVALQDSARLGDEVWVISFPWGRRLTVVSGVVSHIASEDGQVALEGPVGIVDAPASYGTSGGGVFDTATGRLLGVVEGYRTARVTLQTAPERMVDIPVPGETTVVASPVIRQFLTTSGLEAFRAR